MLGVLQLKWMNIVHYVKRGDNLAKSRIGIKSMDSIKVRSSSGRVLHKEIDGKELIRIANKDPESLIGVKSSRVYAQIAKTGRNPDQFSSREKLITALNTAITVKEMHGTVKVRKVPAYIPMAAKDVKICFGKEISRMPKSSFIDIGGSVK